LYALLCFALLLRLTAVALLHQRWDRPVTYEHGEIAARLLHGEGFAVEFLGAVGPTSQQAPLYPFALAGLYALFGIHTQAAVLSLQLIQCLAGTLLVFMGFHLACSLFPTRPAYAWWAALAATLYPIHVYAVTHVQVALWAALVLTSLWAVCLSPKWSANRWQPLAAGCLAGLLLMIEPILALALPVAAVVLARQSSRRATTSRAAFVSALRIVTLFALTAALFCTPWLIRNRQVHGQWVFIKSTFGYAFWQGNNPVSWGTDKIPKTSALEMAAAHDGSLADRNRALWEARHETLYIDNLLLGASDYAELATLSEPERAQLLGRRAFQFIYRHPQRYAQLCWNRFRYFWLWDATNPKADNIIYRSCSLATLALALVGWRAIGPSGRRACWPLLATVLLVCAFHTLTITSARFRIPIEPLLLIWVGAGAAACCQWPVSLLRRLASWRTPPLPEMHPVS